MKLELAFLLQFFKILISIEKRCIVYLKPFNGHIKKKQFSIGEKDILKTAKIVKILRSWHFNLWQEGDSDLCVVKFKGVVNEPQNFSLGP